MNIFNHINKIKDSVINDVKDVARFHFDQLQRNIKSAGHHSIPRSVFCYVDHLGYIAFGGSSTGRSVKFIKKYFPLNYHEYAELIYSMWRLGTVHEYKPKSYYSTLSNQSSKKITVKWISTIHDKEKQRKLNLLTFPIEGQHNTVYILINNPQLVDDLIISLDKFKATLEKDNQYKNHCESRLANINEAQEYSTTSNSISNTVKEQIRHAWHTKGGLLNKKGNMIEDHPQYNK